ncbi:MAG: radical SAM protein [Treponema sp.]|jgi:hypothetical protein|nr:radical SAM protein [Treponema sp.]
MIEREIVIDTSAILVTFKCNLRCKLCCTSSPYQKNPEHFSIERLEAILNRYFELVRLIRKLSFGGGEPMLRTDMAELIEITMKHGGQFDIFEIITNGTIIPADKVLDTIEKFKDKMYIMIDKYGDLSINADKLAGMFKGRGINHSIRKYYGEDAHCGGWVDLGDFAHKNNAEAAVTLLSECCIPNKPKVHTGLYIPVQGESALTIPYMACTNGILHRCARAYATMLAGSVPVTAPDFIDIMDDRKSLDQIREEIHSLYMMDYLSACEYCNGFSSSSRRYMPAEQLS